MAKITGPLLSVTASGKIAERLVFSLRTSGQQVRFQRSQKNIITEARTSQREIYSNAVSAWKVLPSITKIEWIEEAKCLNLTGYNLFMQNYLNNFIDGHSKSYYGIAIFGDSVFGAV